MSDTAIIPLTNHGYTIVDADLFEWLNQWKWYLSPEGYAFRYQKVRVGKFKKLYMHVAINQTPDGFRTAYNEAAERLQGEFCNPNKCN